jgi:hypothetical protein
MKWTRQRCQVTPLRTFAIAVRRPSWASEITRRTPFRPRLIRGLADLVEGRVEPHVGVLTFDRARRERPDPFIEHLTDPGDLQAGDPIDPEGTDQVIDLARGLPVPIGDQHHYDDHHVPHGRPLAEQPNANRSGDPAQAECDRRRLADLMEHVASESPDSSLDEDMMELRAAIGLETKESTSKNAK